MSKARKAFELQLLADTILFYTHSFEKEDQTLTEWEISAVSVTALDSSGEDASAVAVDAGAATYSGNMATIKISDGRTPGETYTVKILATMTSGDVIAVVGTVETVSDQ